MRRRLQWTVLCFPTLHFVVAGANAREATEALFLMGAFFAYDGTPSPATTSLFGSSLKLVSRQEGRRLVAAVCQQFINKSRFDRFGWWSNIWASFFVALSKGLMQIPYTPYFIASFDLLFALTTHRCAFYWGMEFVKCTTRILVLFVWLTKAHLYLWLNFSFAVFLFKKNNPHLGF